MCLATNSSLGVVKPFFASLDFEAIRPWVMPDDWCVTAYTATELSLLPASPKAWGSILKISSRYSTNPKSLRYLSEDFSPGYFDDWGGKGDFFCVQCFVPRYAPSSLVSPVFIPIWYLAKLCLVVLLFPPRAWQSCDLPPVEWLNVLLPLSLRMVARPWMTHLNAINAAAVVSPVIWRAPQT